MAVPNNYSFKLSDVANEIPGGQSSLEECITESTDSLFDPAYKGSKNSLRNFRNYNASTTTSVSLGFGSTASAACTAQGTGNNVTRYMPLGQGFSTATHLYSNSAGTTNAPYGYYSQSGIVRLWSGNSFSGSTQFCGAL
ncbi:hypothetical protein [Ulvibacterium sp.]|uniref:hypothetical protein n=1 Tax=Ulvibacterium sp. TaxID=2665914 RepID=UPI003BAC46B9